MAVSGSDRNVKPSMGGSSQSLSTRAVAVGDSRCVPSRHHSERREKDHRHSRSPRKYGPPCYSHAFAGSPRIADRKLSDACQVMVDRSPSYRANKDAEEAAAHQAEVRQHSQALVHATHGTFFGSLARLCRCGLVCCAFVAPAAACHGEEDKRGMCFPTISGTVKSGLAHTATRGETLRVSCPLN